VGSVYLSVILFPVGLLLWLLHCYVLSECRTDGFTFESDLEMILHPSQIMDFDEDAKRMSL
jgi:hypothetical protein